MQLSHPGSGTNLGGRSSPDLEADQVSLVWDAVADADQYVVAISSNPDHLAQGEGEGVITVCSDEPKANIDNLTPNETIYIRIWAQVNGQWTYQDYVINRDETVYLINDHLGTPRQAVNGAQEVIWRWEGDGFGVTPPDEDVNGDSQITEINFRFPGQYYDQESGLYYNWNRYYDPATGRYVTSDPAGFDGGINTYGYVGQNPMIYTDSEGLQFFTVLDSDSDSDSDAVTRIQVNRMTRILAPTTVGTIQRGALKEIYANLRPTTQT